jgi:hypothetical protein
VKQQADPTSTPHRSKRRLQQVPRAGGDVRALPRGLSAEERAWIHERAALAGGVTAAFRHLVRLAILHDALTATTLAYARLAREALGAGLGDSERQRRLRAWAGSRASSACGARFLNLVGWRRPGTPGGYGRAPEDDPAQPLPRATVRRLIAEGRPLFRHWPAATAAHDGGEPARVTGGPAVAPGER